MYTNKLIKFKKFRYHLQENFTKSINISSQVNKLSRISPNKKNQVAIITIIQVQWKPNC